MTVPYYFSQIPRVYALHRAAGYSVLKSVVTGWHLFWHCRAYALGEDREFRQFTGLSVRQLNALHMREDQIDYLRSQTFRRWP